MRQRSQVVHSSQRPSPWPVPGDSGAGGALGGGDSVVRTDLESARESRQPSQRCCLVTGSSVWRRLRCGQRPRTLRCVASPVCASLPPLPRPQCPMWHMQATPSAAVTPETCLPRSPAPQRRYGGARLCRSDVSHRKRSAKRDARRPAGCGSAVRQEEGSSPPSERTVVSTAVVARLERHRLAATAESHGPAADVPLGAADTLVPFSS